MVCLCQTVSLRPPGTEPGSQLMMRKVAGRAESPEIPHKQEEVIYLRNLGESRIQARWDEKPTRAGSEVSVSLGRMVFSWKLHNRDRDERDAAPASPLSEALPGVSCVHHSDPPGVVRGHLTNSRTLTSSAARAQDCRGPCSFIKKQLSLRGRALF